MIIILIIIKTNDNNSGELWRGRRHRKECSGGPAAMVHPAEHCSLVCVASLALFVALTW